jgi:hypothetical protein
MNKEDSKDKQEMIGKWVADCGYKDFADFYRAYVREWLCFPETSEPEETTMNVCLRSNIKPTLSRVGVCQIQ